MHRPPAVSYPFGRSRILAWLLLGASLCGAGVCLAWYQQMGAPGWRLALALATWCAGAWLSWQTWRTTATGQFHWDGHEWQLQMAGRCGGGQPAVRLDWQGGMLLSWQNPGSPVQWLCVERAADPGRWDDLRRAVYSRAATGLLRP